MSVRSFTLSLKVYLYPRLPSSSFVPVAIASPLYSKSDTSKTSSLTIPLKFTLSEIVISKLSPACVPSGISKSILVFRLRSVVSLSVLSSLAVGFTIVVFSPFSAPPIVISTFSITFFSFSFSTGQVPLLASSLVSSAVSASGLVSSPTSISSTVFSFATPPSTFETSSASSIFIPSSPFSSS